MTMYSLLQSSINHWERATVLVVHPNADCVPQREREHPVKKCSLGLDEH